MLAKTPKNLTRGLLETTEVVRQFVFGGRATLTLESLATGSRYTYKIEGCEDNANLFFVKVMTGADNSNSFTYLGALRRSVAHKFTFHATWTHGKKSKIGTDAPSARAWEWFSRAMHQADLPATLRVWHEGRCAKCARKLTVPASVATGFGPECAEKMGVAWEAPVCEAIAA